MKKMNILTRHSLLLLLIITAFYACQPKTETVPSPKDVALYEVSPNEKENVKLVNDYINALLASEYEKAKGLVSEGFMNYGPSKKDSTDIDGVTSGWAKEAKVRSNQDVGIYATTSLKVNEGKSAGEWVYVWGNYTATLNDSGYTFDVPWHRVYFIKDNKIEFTRAWFDNLSVALDRGSVAPVEAK